MKCSILSITGFMRKTIIAVVLLLGPQVSAQGTMFDAHVTYGVGNSPQGVHPADLDGDGDVDLAVANGGTNYVSVLINNGDGTYQPAVSYQVGTNPYSVYAADLNGDNHKDLAVANHNSHNLSVLFNNGDGTFQPEVSYAVGTKPISVIAANLDTDEYVDLAVINYVSNDVSVLINAGDGTFEPAVNYPALGDARSMDTRSMCVADFDDDGSKDLAIANQVSQSMTVLFNVGDGTFETAQLHNASNGPHAICSADFDLDGDADIAIPNNPDNTVSLFTNDGDRVFQGPIDYAAGYAPPSIAAGDLDGNGYPDIVTANANDNVAILLNQGNAVFGVPDFYGVGAYPTSVCVADLNGDGRLDLAVANANSDNVSILINISNQPPILDPIDVQQLHEGGHLELLVSASDPDEDDLELRAEDLPENATLADSGNGHGLFTFDPTSEQSGQYSVLFIVDDGGLADSQAVAITVLDGNPVVESIAVDGEADTEHVISHTPEISWAYTDPLERRAQIQVEMALGADDDWAYAEMWNPAPFETGDTFIVYAGIALLDGETYYLRLRVHNGLAWSDWFETTFRMNSLPSAPVQHSPIDGAMEAFQPVLAVELSTDAENDSITYDVELFDDTLSAPLTTGYDIEASGLTAAWGVDIALQENQHYFWRARAFDQFEYSDWTGCEDFWMNTQGESPAMPDLSYPPDTGNMPVFNLLPTFLWSECADPDPLDTVRYKLEIAHDSNFDYVNTIDSLLSASHELDDSLSFSTHYWWRVTAFDNTGRSTVSVEEPDFWTWTLGDLDHNHSQDIADLVMLVDFMFNGGPPPYPLFVADINGDCSNPIDIADLVYLVDYMFNGGPGPLPCY